jgi:hypothetical protein
MMTAVLSVGNVAILEGNAGNQRAAVVVSLSEPHGSRVTVDYRTVNGTATAGRDFNAVSGKLTFAKGETSKTIQIPVIGDRVPEVDKTFSVKFSDAKHAKIANRTGVVTILDDEPRISISDVSTKEGNSNTTPFTFTVSLSAAYDQPVTVNYVTANGSASAGIDYTAASGQLVFAPGQTSQTFAVAVNGNRLPGPDKTFSVCLSTQNNYAVISKGVGIGTIIDDEPRINISDTYNNYATSFTFLISLSAAYDHEVTVKFTTMDGTAIAGVDYAAKSGTLIFDPGVTSQTITVDVLDQTSMWDKYFSVQFSVPSANALLASDLAYGYGDGYGYYDPGYYYDSGYYYYDSSYGY